MKIKEFFSDIKIWIGFIIFFIMIGVGFASWAKLPDKVKAVENNIQQLAGDIKTYIAVNEAQKTEAEKREALMLKLIEQNNDKGKSDTNARHPR